MNISKKINRVFIALVLAIGIFAVKTTVNAEETKVTTPDEFKDCIRTAGATCVLDADIESAANYAPANNITIKLNNHRLFRTGTVLTIYTSGGNVNIVGPGVLESTNNNNGGVIVVYGSTKDEANFSTLNISENVEIKNPIGWGIYIQNQVVTDSETNKKSYPCYGATINLTDSKVDAANGVTILGNFQDIDAKNPPVINLKNSIIDVDGTGLYAAGFGLYNVIDSKISGKSDALGIKSGTVTVKNSELTSDGEYISDVEGNNNGINKSGSVVQIELNDGYADHIKLYLEDSKIISEEAHAFYQYLANENTSLSEVKELKIKNCEVYSKQNNFKVTDNFTMTKFIEGGKFTSKPELKYISDGYTAYNVGSMYVVSKTEKIEGKNIVLKIGESAKMHSNTPDFVGYNLFIPVDVFDSFGDDEEAFKNYIDKLNSVATIDEKTGTVTAKKAGSVSYELHLTDFSDMDNVPSALVTIVVLEDAKVANEDSDLELSKDDEKVAVAVVNEEVASMVTDALEVEDEKDLTDLQKAIVESVLAGKTVSAEIKTDKVESKDLPKDIIEKLESKDTGEIAAYFDISIAIYADGEKIGELTDLNQKVKISLVIPELPKLESNKTRNYSILRYHDGKVDVLKATDNGDGTISFESDKYSTYALTYKDSVKAEETKPADKAEATKELDDTPNTGKTIALVGLALMSLSIGTTLVIKKNKKLI